MPTARQKRVAELIIENQTLDKPLNGGELLEKVRYGKISKQPSRVLESEGVLEALNDFGFNVDNAKKVVAKILLDERVKPETRINASKEVFKVHGEYAPEKHVNTNVNVNIDSKSLEIARKYEEELKQGL